MVNKVDKDRPGFHQNYRGFPHPKEMDKDGVIRLNDKKKKPTFVIGQSNPGGASLTFNPISKKEGFASPEQIKKQKEIENRTVFKQGELDGHIKVTFELSKEHVRKLDKLIRFGLKDSEGEAQQEYIKELKRQIQRALFPKEEGHKC